MLSAFWHGFYGGYYFSFFLWFIHVFVSQLVFKESKKEKSPWVKIYKMTGFLGKAGLWIASNLTFTVCGLFFQILSLKQSLRVLNALYYAPILFYFLVYVLFTFGATK